MHRYHARNSNTKFNSHKVLTKSRVLKTWNPNRRVEIHIFRIKSPISTTIYNKSQDSKGTTEKISRDSTYERNEVPNLDFYSNALKPVNPRSKESAAKHQLKSAKKP